LNPEIKSLIFSLYKNERGEPLIATPSQCDIFEFISKKLSPRGQAMCFTRFGKSLFSGLGVLTRVATFPEKWAVVSHTKDKARIIMNHIIGHIFDSDYTKLKFVPDRGERVEDIKRYRNKSHLTFDLGTGRVGEIFICSAKEALGYGAPNVIEDEAAVIENDAHSLVMRMVGDNPNDNFLFKIGNPINRNHFLKSHNDPTYKKFIVDCYKGLEEGRISQEIIDENKAYRFFSILYECKFPSPTEIDEQGWSLLITEEEIKTAVDRIVEPYGLKRLGVDVARGGRCFNAYVIRRNNEAWVIGKDRDDDLMSVTGRIRDIVEREKINIDEIYVDDTGVGGGVTDRLKEIGFAPVAVKFGERSSSPREYINVRAELYAGKEGLANWLRRTGKLREHPDWFELLNVRYKKTSERQLKLESKDDMRSRGIDSPDVVDALVLTFAQKQRPVRVYQRSPEEILASGVKPFFPELNI